MRPSVYVLLSDTTGTANTAFNVDVDTRDYDAIGFIGVLVGGVTPAAQSSSIRLSHSDLTTFVAVDIATITTGVDSFGGGAGLGVDANAAINGGASWSGPLAYGARVTVPAMGVGITVRMRVWGRRNFRVPSDP